MSPSSAPERYVEIAKIGRPHGVRGEVRCFPLNEDTEALYEGAALRWSKGKKTRELTIASMRPAKGHWIVWFEGLEGRDAVAVLNGGMLAVPRSSLPELEDGEVYVGDLLGLRVVDEADGTTLGEVEKLAFSNVEVLDIRLTAGGRVLVPYIAQYVGEVDLDGGTIAVRDIDHWMDL